MQNETKQSDSFLRSFFRQYFDLRQDKENEESTIESIKQGVEFRGANLWILIFAILVASLGLNVNSTAVIIGAMLISPLMGPIIGMGLAVGINDFTLMKRSVKSYLLATVISVCTATVYFSLTPLDEVQSELLARTSPTIYDVFIALFGGLAGIVALATKGKGNVLPGVAIATALMPPLCTAGFGLATGHWLYFLGAFYLFFINTVFISVATFIGVRMMHFPQKVFVNRQHEKKVRQSLIFIVVVTMCPSIYMTYKILQETFYTSNVTKFITSRLNWHGTQVIAHTADFSKREIRVVLVGNEMPKDSIRDAEADLSYFKLGGSKLKVIQGASTDSLTLRNMINVGTNQTYVLQEQAQRIYELERALGKYQSMEALSTQLISETKILFPQVVSLSMAPIVKSSVDKIKNDTFTVAIVTLSKRMDSDQLGAFQEWLKMRSKTDSLDLIINR